MKIQIMRVRTRESERERLTTGMTWVTPSPLSMTVPVRVLSPTCREVQDAARARTAWEHTEKGHKTLM